MFGKNPKPKTSDGIILFGTVCLMGAPTVYPHFSEAVGHWLFYGGLGGMFLYSALRWGSWLWREFTAPAAIAPAPSGGAGGAHIGRDNSGSQTVIHGPVTINTPLPFPALKASPLPPQEPKPQRDTKISAAVNYIVLGRWDRRPPPPATAKDAAQYKRALGELRQAARDGEIVVWAYRLTDLDEYEKVSANFWSENKIDYDTLLGDRAEADYDYHLPLPPYVGFMVSKAQIEKIWPPKTTIQHDHGSTNWTPYRLKERFGVYELAAILARTDPHLDINRHEVDAYYNLLIEQMKNKKLEYVATKSGRTDEILPSAKIMREKAIVWAKQYDIDVSHIE